MHMHMQMHLAHIHTRTIRGTHRGGGQGLSRHPLDTSVPWMVYDEDDWAHAPRESRSGMRIWSGSFLASRTPGRGQKSGRAGPPFYGLATPWEPGREAGPFIVRYRCSLPRSVLLLLLSFFRLMDE
jgi:hypothetical protein